MHRIIPKFLLYLREGKAIGREENEEDWEEDEWKEEDWKDDEFDDEEW